ncbi:MAG: DUF1194 domain-containing protein [Proteobacteria bacterium]|nr:DUF1194 domain-containing protein [Pseudomonadota bacterium]
MSPIFSRFLVPAAVFCVLASAPVRAAPVDVELVLAVDASGSVDEEEYLLQRAGYAKAFSHPRVIDAIRGGVHRAIAVTYVEWTGPGLYEVIAGWTLIDDAESAKGFADLLFTSPRELFSGGTAVGDAIIYSATLFDDNGFEGARRVIDISGDGPTNKGRPASWARDEVVRQGITINGLPIIDEYYGLHVFFLDHVIGGPGAFAIPAKDFASFQSAVLSKLIREIAGDDPSSRPDKRAVDGDAEVDRAQAVALHRRRGGTGRAAYWR